MVATIIFVALLVTSTKAWRRTLGPNWKRLQRLVWFVLPLALAHTIFTGQRLDMIESLSVLLFGIVLVFVVAEFLVLMRRRKARGQARHGDTRPSSGCGDGSGGYDLRSEEDSEEFRNLSKRQTTIYSAEYHNLRSFEYAFMGSFIAEPPPFLLRFLFKQANGPSFDSPD